MSVLSRRGHVGLDPGDSLKNGLSGAPAFGGVPATHPPVLF